MITYVFQKELYFSSQKEITKMHVVYFVLYITLIIFLFASSYAMPIHKIELHAELIDHHRPLYSIVISTYERTECLRSLVDNLLTTLREDGNIIIADDHSTSVEKLELLNNYSKDHRIEVLYNDNNYGTFHTKLRGFLHSKALYVMSADDDDNVDPGYYEELYENLSPEYDFIIPCNGFYSKWFKTKSVFSDIKNMVSLFHNHVTMAIRRDMFDGIDYPNTSVPINRDDAVLVIPLYAKSSSNRVKVFYNTKVYHYIIDNALCGAKHEKSRSKISNIKNGYDFILKYLSENHREDLIPYVKVAYEKYRF